MSPVAVPPSPIAAASARSHQTLPHHCVDFAHESERQFASLLDFYGIAWEYEPRQFELEHNAGGDLVRAFTPDFYLPGYDLYLELTTLKQKLVTKKNRKAREVMERYPGVRVKILYQRDVANLTEKYGLAS